MAVNTTNGTIYSAPRVIETKDNRAGCPGTQASDTDLMLQTITVDHTAVYWVHGRIIFNAASRVGARADIYVLIDGVSAPKSGLNTITNSVGATNINAWEELNVTYTGTFTAGTHTIAIRGSNGTNCWGCGADWGNMTTLIWEAA